MKQIVPVMVTGPFALVSGLWVVSRHAPGAKSHCPVLQSHAGLHGLVLRCGASGCSCLGVPAFGLSPESFGPMAPHLASSAWFPAVETGEAEPNTFSRAAMVSLKVLPKGPFVSD